MRKRNSVIAAIVCVLVVIGLFGYITWSRGHNTADETELTEVQKLAAMDIEKNYPATPREVVKMYNRIISCFYNSDCTEDEVTALGDQARLLFDEELLENNPRDQYFEDLKLEIEDYKSQGKTINSASVCSSNEVEFKTIDSRECAYVTVNYFISNGKAKSYERTYQTYVLRKDTDGKWKILVFYLTEGDSSNE